MALNITITDAGRAELINAQNTGTGPVEIAEIGIGTGEYLPAANQTALVAEIKRLTTFSGVVVADNIIHVSVRDEGNDAYDVAEFGLYTDSGTLFAVYSQDTGPFMQKSAQSSLLLAVDIAIAGLDVTTLSFGDTNFVNPQASETVAGLAEIATQAEVDAGDDDMRFVTAKKLRAIIKKISPLGQSFWHQGDTPPVGCMQYSGQILSRSTHADLWADINDPDRNITIVTQAQAASRPGCWHSGDGSTTFGVPSMPGEIIRVWDSSGLIDADRVLGSHQEDQSLHVDGANFGGAQANTITIPEDGSWSSRVRSGRSTDGNDAGVQFKMNAAETRMKNTAWMLCFRYEY